MKRDKLMIYRCPVCETVVEVLDACGLELVCCGPQMVALPEQSAEKGMEQHLPMISRLGDGFQVVVGDGRHCMEPDHHVAWIELICDGKVQRQFLESGQWPVAFFEAKGQKIIARSYCTMHGLWKAVFRGHDGTGLLWPEMSHRRGHVPTASHLA